MLVIIIMITDLALRCATETLCHNRLHEDTNQFDKTDTDTSVEEPQRKKHKSEERYAGEKRKTTFTKLKV